mgnify:CR=1 FL=1
MMIFEEDDLTYLKFPALSDAILPWKLPPSLRESGKELQ